MMGTSVKSALYENFRPGRSVVPWNRSTPECFCLTMTHVETAYVSTTRGQVKRRSLESWDKQSHFSSNSLLELVPNADSFRDIIETNQTCHVFILRNLWWIMAINSLKRDILLRCIFLYRHNIGRIRVSFQSALESGLSIDTMNIRCTPNYAFMVVALD